MIANQDVSCDPGRQLFEWPLAEQLKQRPIGPQSEHVQADIFERRTAVGRELAAPLDITRWPGGCPAIANRSPSSRANWCLTRPQKASSATRSASVRTGRELVDNGGQRQTDPPARRRLTLITKSVSARSTSCGHPARRQAARRGAGCESALVVAEVAKQQTAGRCSSGSCATRNRCAWSIPSLTTARAVWWSHCAHAPQPAIEHGRKVSAPAARHIATSCSRVRTAAAGPPAGLRTRRVHAGSREPGRVPVAEASAMDCACFAAVAGSSSSRYHRGGVAVHEGARERPLRKPIPCKPRWTASSTLVRPAIRSPVIQSTPPGSTVTAEYSSCWISGMGSTGPSRAVFRSDRASARSPSSNRS